MSSGIRLTTKEMRYIALFESITSATVRDCIVDAAIKGESDPLKGVTENVIVGQSIPIGTGLVDLYMSTLARGSSQ